MSFLSNFGKKNIISTFQEGYSPWPFLITTLCYGLTFGLTKGIMDNYLAEIANVMEFERGVIEFCRELPGLFLIFILAAMYRNSDKKNYQIALGIAMIGLSGLAFARSSKWIIVVFLVINSLGEHIVMQVRQSLSIEMAKPGKSGKSLGIMTGFRSLGRITGFLLIPVFYLIFARFSLGRSDARSYKLIYLFALCITIIAFFLSTKIPEIKEKQSNAPIAKIYFNKKFGKYYVLSVFYGARKQVFLTFAPYVLVLQYGASASVMSMLFAITAGMSIIFSPIIGRIIDRIGYRTVMIADTLILIIVCFFYGFAHRLFPEHIAFYVVCSNYVFDSILSLCSMASLVYIKDLADNQKEVSQTISSGISVNHLISIIIALCGGLIWEKAGIELLFSLSALLGLINSIVAATIPKTRKGL
ncbi:MAG: MFS transporter [Spirochaetia bacterium]|nr:MFS transporter [Spirochaetia bacterium]